TTQSGIAYEGPTIPTTSSSPVVEHETDVTKDTVHPANNGSTKDVQPLVVQTQSLMLNSEPVISPIIEPVASPVEEYGVDEPELGKPEPDKLVLDKLEVGFDYG
nr:reverse transcriptase domain-containing protein [Tanacetum cinerariifolium]